MDEYTLRKATRDDVNFLADVVISAEKSGTDKLSFATIFDLSETQAKEYIVAMFKEEIDGCELSVSSFIIAGYMGNPVAALGGWVETLNEDVMASSILKANLINYTFGKDAIAQLKTRADSIKELVSEREPLTLQLEYLYVLNEHRGKGIFNMLIAELEKQAVCVYPELTKVQLQVYVNNFSAIKVYERNGFVITRLYKTNYAAVLNLLPYHEKYLMEKKIKIK